MYFAQHYLDCLSQASYLIGDETTGRAVVVDPRRDVSEYLADAGARGFTIEAVINTTSTPTSPPGTWNSRPRPGPGSATGSAPPRSSTRSGGWPTASGSAWAM